MLYWKGFRAMKKSGFTLIELLIVVAIIGILAAIAIPNFLLAQMRAKVARQVADFRNISIAFEAYAVDHNDYPPPAHLYWSVGHGDWFLLCPFPMGKISGWITTPISYMSEVPPDVFTGGRIWLSEAKRNSEVCPTNQNWLGDIYWLVFGDRVTFLRYLLVGMGPNKRYETDQDCAPLSMPITVGYNPSNGTMSAGDIHWFGPGSLTSVSPTIGS